MRGWSGHTSLVAVQCVADSVLHERSLTTPTANLGLGSLLLLDPDPLYSKLVTVNYVFSLSRALRPP